VYVWVLKLFIWFYYRSALDKNSSKPNRRKELNKQGKVTEPEKSVDFVLVYEKSAVTDDAYTKIETFIFNLEQKGFQLKSSVFTVSNSLESARA
jgi:hypothetical protein